MQEDSKVLRYFTPIQYGTQFSGDKAVIRKLDCSSPFLGQSYDGYIKQNLLSKDKKLKIIGKPKDKQLKPVRNMIVNNISIILDQKIDRAIKGKQVYDQDFDEYKLAVLNEKINDVNTERIEDFLFFRKQVDALFVKTKRWMTILFFLHLIYILLVVLPIFFPNYTPDFRKKMSHAQLGMSFFFFILELM